MLLEIGAKQAIMCNENSVSYINCLVTCMAMRNLIHTVYCALVCMKKVVKIEQLPIDEKNSLWLQTKEFSENKLETEDAIKLSKCLYSIEYFLNL